MSGLVTIREDYPLVMCLSPNCALAMKTGIICEGMKITLTSSRQMLPFGYEETDQVLFGTPEKLLEWAKSFRLFDRKQVTVFVLDEANAMIAAHGHRDQYMRVDKRLNPRAQVILFPSSYTEKILRVADSIVPKPTIIRFLTDEDGPNIRGNIKIYHMICQTISQKYWIVQRIYESIKKEKDQAIVFCESRFIAESVAKYLKENGCQLISLLTGVLTMQQRLLVEDNFRAGCDRLLIATNVLSRGIDASQVKLIVNFDLPIDDFGRIDLATYALTKINRTGRFAPSGISINLIDDKMPLVACVAIEEHFKRRGVEFVNVRDLLRILKIRISLLFNPPNDDNDDNNNDNNDKHANNK